MSEEKTWFLKVIVPHSQASYGAKDYAGDLEEAWKKIEKIPGDQPQNNALQHATGIIGG
jgi:hypothetical protein